ncbi:unnamed protein product [Heligmosomoides polygyrus]|uniref:Major sperm protein n=1 Tax=Heligmosomoides polygyrus TaxID=6339 RepID=A0A183GUL9_HELPZ|nr:unnamed protein product [Heligmosomoides polygyrus]
MTNNVVHLEFVGNGSKELPSFWIPELNPTASASKLEKPSQKVLCPLSGKPLRMKDLMEVKFTRLPNDDDNINIISAKVRYMCAVTHDALTNTTRCAYLKKSSNNPALGTGYAATNEVKAKLIRPQLELQ